VSAPIGAPAMDPLSAMISWATRGKRSGPPRPIELVGVEPREAEIVDLHVRGAFHASGRERIPVV
jgi:hypothetical protein